MVTELATEKSGWKEVKTSIRPKKGLYNLIVHQNNEPLSDNLIFIQNSLRPALTPVLHNRDHRRLVDDLAKLNQALPASGLETKAIEFALESLPKGASARQS